MPDGEFFPSDVGLDENVSCEWWGAEYVDQKPTINMTVDELVARFHEAYEGKKTVFRNNQRSQQPDGYRLG